MDSHSKIIWLLSFTVSFVFALVFSTTAFKFQIKAVERWAKPFARMFWALALMYFIQILGWFVTDGNHFPLFIDKAKIDLLVNFGVSLCSAASNFFLLYVAYNLWSEEHSAKSNGFEPHNQLPKVSWTFVGIVFLELSLLAAFEKFNPWLRLPDALISAACLTYAGFAFYQSISSRRLLRPSEGVSREKLNAFHKSRLIASSARFFSTFYGLLHILYGVTPLLFKEPTAESLDHYIITLALLLKMGVFYPAYFLLISIATTHKKIRPLLEQVVNGKKEFLEDEGLVRVIKESLQVTSVDLFIKLPGNEDNQVAIYSFPSKNVDADKKPNICSLNDEPAQIFKLIDRTGMEFRLNISGYSSNYPPDINNKFNGRKSIIVTPISYHEAIVGCLSLELENEDLKESDVQQVREISYLIAPAVQAYREIAALDRISFKLASLQLDQQELHIHEAVRKITEILYDVLNPVAIGIFTEVGFEKSHCIMPENWQYSKRLVEACSHHGPQTENELVWYPKPLTILSKMIDDRSKRPFGSLVLVTQAETDKNKTSPIASLATYFLYRQVVTNMATDLLFDFARDYFSKVLKDLGVAFNEMKDGTIQAWFECIGEFAKRAGLVWVVATRPTSDRKLGKPANIRLAESFKLPPPPDKTGYFYKNQQKQKIFFERYRSRKEDGYCMVPLYLKDSEQTIWVGIGNSHFDPELDYLSPWRVFLERFAEIADSALYRINATIFKKETAEIQRWAKVAFANPAIIHQIVNQVKSLITPIEMLEMAVQYGHLKGNDIHHERIFTLRSSANDLLDLSGYFVELDRADERNQPLIESVQDAVKIWSVSLKKYNIRIETNIKPELRVDVPFLSAVLAISDLISNSKDAIKEDNNNKNGLIQIESQELNGKILLHIIDNGPGVPENIRENLFNLPVVSSKKYGKGKGLFYSNHLLRTDNAYIKATSFRHPTKFTIYFPRAKKVTKK